MAPTYSISIASVNGLRLPTRGKFDNYKCEFAEHSRLQLYEAEFVMTV